MDSDLMEIARRFCPHKTLDEHGHHAQWCRCCVAVRDAIEAALRERHATAAGRLRGVQRYQRVSAPHVYDMRAADDGGWVLFREVLAALAAPGEPAPKGEAMSTACHVCGLGPLDTPSVPVFRQNALGVAAVWACAEHGTAPVDEDVREIVAALTAPGEPAPAPVNRDVLEQVRIYLAAETHEDAARACERDELQRVIVAALTAPREPAEEAGDYEVGGTIVAKKPDGSWLIDTRAGRRKRVWFLCSECSKPTIDGAPGEPATTPKGASDGN